MMAKTQKQADAALVVQAVKDGKFSADWTPVWMNALQADRAGTTRVIAALVGVLPVEQSHSSAARAAVTSDSARVARLNASAQTMSDAEADAELYRIGYRDGIEAPPQPKWWELFPPEEV